MPSIIENLNSVITTKNELNSILRENGVNPGEVFSDYPTYFRDVISSGGSDKVTYSYLEERLSDYVSYSYGNDNYVSYAYLNEQEYATESYVAEYVAEHGGGEVTYSYLNDNYLNLSGGTIEGNIFPKYQNTYSLGETNSNFGAVWTRNLISNNRLMVTANYGNGYHGLILDKDLFGPLNQDNLYNLGNSTYQWAGVYSNKYELNGVDIKEIFPSYSYVNKYVTKNELSAQSYITSADIHINENIVPKETKTYTLGDADHLYNVAYTTGLFLHPSNGWVNVSNWQTKFRIGNSDKFYLTSNRFYPNISGDAHLGSSGNSWGDTYTNNLYTNTAYLQDTSYSSSIVPKENNTYTLGSNDSKFSATYTENLYLGTYNIKDLINGMFSYDSTTGTLTITTLS